MFKLAGVHVTRTSLAAQYGLVATGGVCLLAPISGQIEGPVVFEFSKSLLMRLATRLVEAEKVRVQSTEDAKNMMQAAARELATQMTGRAVQLLAANSIAISVAPCTLLAGAGHALVPDHRRVVLADFQTAFGDFRVDLALKSSHQALERELQVRQKLRQSA